MAGSKADKNGTGVYGGTTAWQKSTDSVSSLQIVYPFGGCSPRCCGSKWLEVGQTQLECWQTGRNNHRACAFADETLPLAVFAV